MQYIDVGGGLGIDFDGTKTSSNTSTNYSLQNYANDVIATIKDSCELNNIKHPTIISESGRAIISHCSVLIFNVLGTSQVSSNLKINDKKKQSRIISGLIKNKSNIINLINIYVPNGNPINTEKYDYKKKWFDSFNKKIKEIINKNLSLIHI